MHRQSDHVDHVRKQETDTRKGTLVLTHIKLYIYQQISTLYLLINGSDRMINDLPRIGNIFIHTNTY